LQSDFKFSSSDPAQKHSGERSLLYLCACLSASLVWSSDHYYGPYRLQGTVP